MNKKLFNLLVLSTAVLSMSACKEKHAGAKDEKAPEAAAGHDAAAPAHDAASHEEHKDKVDVKVEEGKPTDGKSEDAEKKKVN